MIKPEIKIGAFSNFCTEQNKENETKQKKKKIKVKRKEIEISSRDHARIATYNLLFIYLLNFFIYLK